MLSYSSYYYDYYVESASRAMTGYYIAYIVISLISGVIFGCITKSINEKKGRDGGFAWGFWLGVIGIIVVACRPAIEYDDGQSYYRNPQQMSSGGWQCSCGRTHSAYETSCVCGGSKRNAPVVIQPPAAPAQPQAWICTCGRHHAPYESSCACGKLRSMVLGAPNVGRPIPTAPPAVMPGEHSKQDFTSSKPAAAPNENDNIQTLRKYKSLLDEGVITQEEYDAKKKELLGL